MTKYSRQEIREGRQKIDRLTEQLMQAASDLTEGEHITDCMQKELDEATSRIIALAWDIVFPPTEMQGVYGDISHLWNIENTIH